MTLVVVGEFDSPAFHQQAEDYATALEGILANPISMSNKTCAVLKGA